MFVYIVYLHDLFTFSDQQKNGFIIRPKLSRTNGHKRDRTRANLKSKFARNLCRNGDEFYQQRRGPKLGGPGEQKLPAEQRLRNNSRPGQQTGDYNESTKSPQLKEGEELESHSAKFVQGKGAQGRHSCHHKRCQTSWALRFGAPHWHFACQVHLTVPGKKERHRQILYD